MTNLTILQRAEIILNSESPKNCSITPKLYKELAQLYAHNQRHLPPHLQSSLGQEMKATWCLIQKNEKLAEVILQELPFFVNELIKLSKTGIKMISASNVNQHCCVVPRATKVGSYTDEESKEEKPIMNTLPRIELMYKGLMHLAVQTCGIAVIDGDDIYAGDTFSHTEGQMPHHVKNNKERLHSEDAQNPIQTYVYAIKIVSNTREHVYTRVLTYDQIQNIMNDAIDKYVVAGKGVKKGSPEWDAAHTIGSPEWEAAIPQVYKKYPEIIRFKTVAKRLCKLILAQSPQANEAMSAAIEHADNTEMNVVGDPTFTIESKPPAKFMREEVRDRLIKLHREQKMGSANKLSESFQSTLMESVTLTSTQCEIIDGIAREVYESMKAEANPKVKPEPKQETKPAAKKSKAKKVKKTKVSK